MDRIGVVGLSWRQGGPQRIAALSLAPEVRAERLPRLARAAGLEELVYLATCNRVELLFRTRAGVAVEGCRRRVFEELAGRAPEPGEAEQSLRAWSGEGAAEHVFLVACGLDSARLGETEITGQLRAALDEARALGLAGRRVGALLEDALQLAKRVRGRTELAGGRTSLAEIALDRARARLALAPGAVALLGVSAMTERCGRSLAAEGARVVVANRTLARAEALAAELGRGARAIDLRALREAPPALAVLVSATGAREPLLGRPELTRLREAAGARPPLVIDLAVPPDVDPVAARELGLEHVGMDEVIAAAECTRSQRLVEMAGARTLVDEALARWRRRQGERAVDAAVVALQEEYRARARVELEKLLRRELAGLDEPGRAALERFADGLARRFAHLPARGLREVVVEGGPAALRAFLVGADGELAARLRDAVDARDVYPELERAGVREDGEDPA